MRRFAVWIGVTIAALTFSVAGRAQQTDQAAGRGPRFLLASRTVPVPLDMSRAPVLSQRISLALDGVTLKDALDSVSREAGLDLVYGVSTIPASRRVHLRADDLSVAAVLTDLLLDAGVDVVFMADGRATLVKRPKPQAVGSIVGQATDSSGRGPVVAVTISVEGTRFAASTAEDGRYRIDGVPAGTYSVTARRIGFRPARQTVAVTDGESATADFVLAPAASKLDEVIVAGSYVESSRRAAPVPVTTLTEEEIHRPTRNRIDQLFRGEVPGVVGYDNGASALGLVAYVRGSASLDDSNLLKVYVDGIEAPANFLVSGIDLSSIERVELLRGPQASTLYGSNASGGVLLLFTKNGRRSPPHLSGSIAGGVTASDYVSGTPVAMEHRLNLSGGGDGFTYSLGGSYDSFGEVIPQGDWRQVGAHGRTVLAQGPLSVALTGSYAHRILGASNFPAFSVLPDPTLTNLRNDDLHLGTGLVGATLSYRPSKAWQHIMTVGLNSINLDENNYKSQDAFEGQGRTASLETDDQFSGRYVSSFATTLTPSVTSSTVAGLELSRRTHNYFQGDGLTNPQVGSSAAFDYIEAYKITTNAGYFAQEVLGFGNRLFLTGGLRAEKNSNVGGGEGLVWAPRGGIAYTIDVGADLAVKPRVSYGKAIRPPQPGQSGGAVSSFGRQDPNPNLRPEVQLGSDAGFDLDFRQGTATLEATYYNQNANDLIGLTYINDPADTLVITQYQNVGRVNNRGLELGAGLLLGPLSLRGTFSTARSRIESLASDYANDDQRPGDEMLYVARRSGGGTAALHFTPLLPTSRAGHDASIELGLMYIGKRPSLDLLTVYKCLYLGESCRGPADDTGTPTFGALRDYKVELSPVTKLRLGFSHPITRRSDAFVNVENLTNKQRGEFIEIAPSRGRTVLVGVRFGQ